MRSEKDGIGLLAKLEFMIFKMTLFLRIILVFHSIGQEYT